MRNEPTETDIDWLLRCRLPMPAADSVAAVILVDGREYLMQLRDRKTTIYYPGHWGLFGGAVEQNESPEQALRRELEEELRFTAGELRYLTEFRFDLSLIGEREIYRKFYEVHVSRDEIARFSLGEGRAMAVFTPAKLFASRLTPYDSFALWLHYLKRGDQTTASGREGVV